MLTKSLIKYKTQFTTKDEVFEEIASLAVEQGKATKKKPIVKGLFAREKESTTGFTDGFAIPHTKSKAIKEAGIVIIVNEAGIDWDSMDGKPARFFIALLIPEKEAGTTHLNALAAVSRMLVSDAARETLLEAENIDEIYTFISNHLDEI